MSELSPAAQEVLAAAINDTADIINKPHCDWIQGYSRQIAAALRAAVEQLAQTPIVIGEPLRGNIAKDAAVVHVADLFAIANELENHQ